MSVQKKKNNVVVLVIIIILVAAIGGYAVFDTQNKNKSTDETTTTIQETTTIVKPTETTTTTQATTVNYKAKYLELINDYENTYGQARYSNRTDYSYLIVGLCYAELIDFNNDGIDELLLLYNEDSYDNGSYNYEIWTYKDGSLENVDSGEPILSNGGLPHIVTTTVNGKKYYVTGGYEEYAFYQFREFKGDKFVEAKSIYEEEANPNELKEWTKNLEDFMVNQNVPECKGKIKTVKNNCK